MAPRLQWLLNTTLNHTPKFFIVDGNAYVHRSYHGIPPLSTSQGEPVNAVYGFIRFLWKLIREQSPDYCVVCFDHPAPTFRHADFPGYKSHRKKMDDDLKVQMPIARDAVRAVALTAIEKPGYEADDVIATLARQSARDGIETVVVTGDKDALQLVTDHITVYNESKNIFYTPAVVREKYGFPAEQLVDYFALMGDASDNVPGLPGVGEKTALKLIHAFGSIDNLFARQDSLEGKLKAIVADNKELLVQSKRLVTLCDNVVLDKSWRECAVQSPDRTILGEFLSRYEFTALAKEMLTAPVPTAKEDFFDLMK